MRIKSLPMIAQVIIGNLFITLPLAFATGYILFHLEEQTNKQKITIDNASQVGRYGHLIESQLKEIERTTKQFSVLREDSLKGLLMNKTRQLDESLSTLESLLPVSYIHQESIGNLHDLLNQIIPILNLTTTKDSLLENVMSSQQPNNQNNGNVDNKNEGTDINDQSESLNTLFGNAKSNATIISQQTQLWVDEQILYLEKELDDTYQNLLILATCMIPVTILATLFVSTITTRPIKRMSKEIWRLGEGNWHDPVEIKGPRDLVALGKRLDWLRTQLMKLDEQKAALLRHVTHELKTPLTSIKEASELLYDEIPGPINEKQRSVLVLQENNILLLQQLIEQLLNYNAVKAGDSTEFVSVNIKEFVGSQRYKLADLASSKNLQWVLTGDNTTILTDEHRLEMAFTNILTNAIKYSPFNGIIGINWEQHENELSLSVTDNGPGVVASERTKIFKPFYQGSPPVKGAIKGSGIGLAITQECMSAIGGTIEVIDTPHAGACFELRLPMLNKDFGNKGLMV